MTFDQIFEQIHTSCVLLKFTLRPDILAKSSYSFNTSFKDFFDPSRNIEVSSAYFDILCSEFIILIHDVPFIFLLCLILFAKNSAQTIKM